MNKAKSFKLIFLSVAFCFALLLGAIFSNFGAQNVVRASYKEDVSNYFDTTSSIEYKNDNLVISAKNDEKLSIVNPLVVNDFAIKLQVPNGAKSLLVEFKSNSYVLHGNENADGEFDDKIINKVYIIV